MVLQKNPTLYRKWRFEMVSKMLEKYMINAGNGEKLKKISARSLELITRTVECDGQTFYGFVQKVCDAIIHDGKALKQTKRKNIKERFIKYKQSCQGMKETMSAWLAR